ncbi:unnamed protein product [Nippostrongylus brasiliensis]|uniref:LAM_G_DOMAIN domain-containing protein n=1 Tax=Nippostrongylus brasiliensis TaxID=27835 RepID=A0A0N4XV20_NIPBR|nr:unnamed protein product [Nippostrongylus brasiliensis]
MAALVTLNNLAICAWLIPCSSPLKMLFRTSTDKLRVPNGETEVDLLVPVESALNSDPRVFRAKGVDGLPAIGIQASALLSLRIQTRRKVATVTMRRALALFQRGVEIAVPYRLYLPRRFFPQFSLLASVKPMDRRGSGQTNISLIYSSRRDASSRAIASFVVPEFVQQWTQIAFEVSKDSVTLYFKCVRFAEREVSA